jgi:hypothetical protein
MISATTPDSGCKLIDRELDRHFGVPELDRAEEFGTRLSPEARQHLENCERCRRLCELLSNETPVGSGTPALHSKIRNSLQGSLQPVSPLPATRTLVIQFLAVFALFVLPISAMMGLSGLHRMDLVQLVSVTVIVAAAAIALAFSLAWQMRPGSFQRFSLPLAFAVLAVGFIGAIGTLFPWQESGRFVAQAWPCSLVGAIVALPAALIFWLLVRRGAPLSITTLGGALGAIAGFLGVTVLQFSCSRQEATHLLVWHGGVLVLSTVGGILVASAVKSFRGEPLR